MIDIRAGGNHLRTPWAAGRQRLAIVDTSAVTSDLVAALRRGRPSALVLAMRANTIRGFIPDYVWGEVPRVLEDRHREGGRFDLEAARALWWSSYVPLLHVVCTAGLPLSAQAQQLMREDPTDVGALVLADVLAPMVLLADDADLRRSGLAHPDWGAVRAGIGKITKVVGVARGAALAAGGGARASWWAGQQVAGLARRFPVWATLSAAGVLVAAGMLHQRRPRIVHHAGVVARRACAGLTQIITQLTVEYRQGDQVWSSAEVGQVGDSMLHRVAQTVACAPSPITRTQIMRKLGLPPARRQMAGLDRLLRRYPMFVEATPGRWQVGRSEVGLTLVEAGGHHRPHPPAFAGMRP